MLLSSNKTRLMVHVVLACVVCTATVPATGQEAAGTTVGLREVADRVAANYNQNRRMFIEGTLGLGETNLEFACAVAPTGEFFAELKGRFLVVYDGRKSWVYAPKGNVYVEMPASELPQSVAGLANYLSHGLRYHARELDNPRRGYRLAGEETLSLGGQTKKCYVLDSPASKVWVDTASYAMVKQLDTSGEGGAGSLTITTTQFGDDVNESLFQFQPPPKAEKVSLQEISSFVSLP